MSTLSGQIDELRLMGDGQAAKGEFTVATLLREAADTIESLRDRLQSGTCELEKLEAIYVTLNMLDQTAWGVCSECGTASPMDATFCCECGRRVKR